MKTVRIWFKFAPKPNSMFPFEQQWEDRDLTEALEKGENAFDTNQVDDLIHLGAREYGYEPSNGDVDAYWIEYLDNNGNWIEFARF